MYEVQVSEEGGARIRKVPHAYHGKDDAVKLFQDSDAVAAELSKYGISDATIEAALEDAQGSEYTWFTVKEG